MAAVLHGRVERWTQAAGGRRRITDDLIAGLIPRAQGVGDPEMARALADRDQGMERRAHTLAEQAIESRHPWVQSLGPAPSDPGRRARWLRNVSTVAAYRDRWHISGESSIGNGSDVASTEQMTQRLRAKSAHDRALAMRTEVERPSSAVPTTDLVVETGVER